VTFQMAEVAVPRQMFADILSLIARLRGAAITGMRAMGQTQQTTPEGRPDAPQNNARFNAAARPTGGFDRLPTRHAICRCPLPAERVILAPQLPGIWRMSV
jgi:hypothetical protein